MNGKAPYKGTEVKMRKPIVAVTADTLLAEMKPINQKMAGLCAKTFDRQRWDAMDSFP